jgi:hypothetical protein
MSDFRLPHLWTARPKVILDWHDRIVDLAAAQQCDAIIRQAKGWLRQAEGYDCADIVLLNVEADEHMSSGAVEVTLKWHDNSPEEEASDDDESEDSDPDDEEECEEEEECEDLSEYEQLAAESLVEEVLVEGPDIRTRIHHLHQLSDIVVNTPANEVLHMGSKWPEVNEEDTWLSLSPPGAQAAPGEVSAWHEKVTAVRHALLALAIDSVVRTLPKKAALDLRPEVDDGCVNLDWVQAPATAMATGVEPAEDDDYYFNEIPAGNCRVWGSPTWLSRHGPLLARWSEIMAECSWELGEPLVDWVAQGASQLPDRPAESTHWTRADAGQLSAILDPEHAAAYERFLLQQSLVAKPPSPARPPRL